MFFSTLFSNLVLADSVRLPDGTSCTFDSYNSPWELSLGTTVKNNNSDFEKFPNHTPRANSEIDDVSVTGQIKYKFGGPKRIDCSRLFELQLRIKEAELKDMEMKLEKLKDASTIEWD